MIAMSITWPRPVCSRARSAVMIPNAVVSAAMPSARPNGGSVGGPSGSPVMAAKPLMASASVPKPGREEYGPNWPKPVTRASTSPGFASCSTSGPMPQRSSVPGPEVLDHHVGVGGQGAEDLLALRGREVQRDRLLVAAEHLPPEADAVALRAVGARRVAARVLDLDHVGAEVAQHRGGERPGEEGGDVEDLESLESACRRGSHRASVLPALTGVRPGSPPRRREIWPATATTRGPSSVATASVIR